MQMCVVEMTERPGKPLFHLEHYIEGKYIKYNSNSGFVRDDNIRLTPQVSGAVAARRGCSPWLRGDNGVLLTSVVPLQAFSHFTFERSGHQLIVVDIQGVGDLYTDPQIHTEKGTDFGDGNLGTARASGWAEARGVNSPGFVWMCCRRARHGALLPLPPVQQDLQEHGPDAL